MCCRVLCVRCSILPCLVCALPCIAVCCSDLHPLQVCCSVWASLHEGGAGGGGGGTQIKKEEKSGGPTGEKERKSFGGWGLGV